MTRRKERAVVVLPDPMLTAHRKGMICGFLEAGGLIPDGADYPDLFQQSAVLVDTTRKCGKPAELPVPQPWRYALVINLKTAKDTWPHHSAIVATRSQRAKKSRTSILQFDRVPLGVAA